MNNIYLVGFMGTGKSAVGKKLAEKKQWDFLDLDNFIERRQARKISDIFAGDGEPYFRKLEKETLREVALKDHQVVACGGGIVIDPDNIIIMRQSGSMICLTASVEVILSRTQGRPHRPLLNVKDPAAAIKELLKKRAPFYAQAEAAVDTSDLSVEQVVDKIIETTS